MRGRYTRHRERAGRLSWEWGLDADDEPWGLPPSRWLDVGIPLLASLGQAYDRLECLMAALACVLEDCQVLLGRHLIQAPGEVLVWPGRSGPSLSAPSGDMQE